MKNFFKAIGKGFVAIASHPGTTAGGIVAIAMAGTAIANNPTILIDPVQGPLVIGTILNGVSNIVSADASKVATMKSEQATATTDQAEQLKLLEAAVLKLREQINK